MVNLGTTDCKKSVCVMHENFFSEFCNPMLGLRIIYKCVLCHRNQSNKLKVKSDEYITKELVFLALGSFSALHFQIEA